MSGGNPNKFSPTELAQHIIVWHLAAQGCVDGKELARSFDRQRQLTQRWDLHTHQHLAVLAIMARGANRQEPAMVAADVPRRPQRRQ